MSAIIFSQPSLIFGIIGSTTINWGGLFFASLTVFITVFVIFFIKVYGRITTDVVGFGSDMNLLTFGFLWDSAVKGLQGEVFWKNYSNPTPPLDFLKAPVALIIVILLNFLIMLLVFQLEGIINQRIEENERARITFTASGASGSPTLPHNPQVIQYIYKPITLALGVFSLMIYLFINSIWS